MGSKLRKKLRMFARSFLANKSGAAYLTPEQVITTSIAFFLAAILLPMGITEVFAANITGWGTAVVTIFQVLFVILGVIGVAMGFIPKRGN